ncbi:unnamed protein product, partial [marine sediment metagenome]
ENMYKEAGDKIIEKYDSLTAGFQEVVTSGDSVLKELKISPKITKNLSEVIIKKIKPKEVSIDGTLLISSNQPDGIEIIKKTLSTIQDFATKKKYRSQIQYMSAPKYRLTITAPDYKTAEKEINELKEIALKNIQGLGESKFIRNDKRDTQMPKV